MSLANELRPTTGTFKAYGLQATRCGIEHQERKPIFARSKGKNVHGAIVSFANASIFVAQFTGANHRQFKLVIGGPSQPLHQVGKAGELGRFRESRVAYEQDTGTGGHVPFRANSKGTGSYGQTDEASALLAETSR